MGVPRDTKTRYQGIYARHKLGCPVEAGERCGCTPNYWSRAWDAGAGRSRKTALLPTIGAVKAARADLERDLSAGRLPASQSMRFAAAVEAFLVAAESGRALNKHGRRYKPSAIRDLRGALTLHAEPALGAKRLGNVRRRDVQLIVDDLSEKSGSRVRTVVNAIRSLYSWAQDRELVDHDPARRVRLPAMDAKPRDRVAAPDELAGLLEVLKIADALPFALAAYATARRGEIRHLTLDDVDVGLGVIYLGVDENGRKSRAAQRAVPIVRPLRSILRRAELARDPDAGALLCPGHKTGGRNSGMLSFEALQARADDAWEPKDEAGNPTGVKLGERITPHECRHTCASWLDAAGVRQVVVSQLMGHATLKREAGAAAITQERYTHSLPGELERAGELFDAYLANEMKQEATG